MDLMGLAAAVCKAFTSRNDAPLREIIAVKDGNARDVVTPLDVHMHHVTREWVESVDPRVCLLSEENERLGAAIDLSIGRCLVVDPLDGSNNFALSVPEFGYMASLLNEGRIEAALVVLPEQNLYLTWDDARFRTSRPFAFSKDGPSAPVYLAYAPELGEEGSRLRETLLRVIDARTAGFYRSGSACLGMFRLLTGAHSALIALEVRLWDVISFFPILARFGFTVRYRIDGFNATVIASRNETILASLLSSLPFEFLASLDSFDLQGPLKVARS